MADREIIRTLHQVRRRLTVVRAVESGLRWAVYGAAGAILAVVVSCLAYSMLPSWYVYPYMPLALIPAAFVLGVAARMLRPITLRDAAIYLDRRAGLHERVSTAYEFAREGDGGGELVAMVRDEALDICRRFRPSTITYGRNISWQVRYLAVALLGCVAILFLPPYKTADYRAREAFDARSRKAAETLRDNIRSIRQDRAITGDAALQELLKKAEEEADRLANAKMTPARMLANMNRLQDDMKRELEEREAEDDLNKAKEQAGKESDSVQAAMKENPTEAEAQKADDLTNRAAEGKASNEEKSALARVGKAAEQAGRAAGDAALEQAGKNVQAAAEGSQTSADRLANDLSRIAKAGSDRQGTTGQGGSQASQGQLKNAIDKVDQAKQASGQSGGQGQTASSSQNGSGGGQGTCPSCGGTGQKNGQTCPDCGGTGQQGGGQQGDQSGSEGGDDGASASSSGGQSQPSLASTNMEGGGQGGHTELEENQTELPWARIYRPKSIDHTSTSEYSPGRVGQGESAGSIMVKGPADPNETATMDYTGDLDAYRKEAMKALEDEHIPARQRELVRNYFLRRSE